MSGEKTSGVSPTAVDFTALGELFIEIRDAKREDIGALASIFIKYFQNDPTARLLYSHDQIWPVIVEMLTQYLADDWTHLRVAWDEYSKTIVGWASTSFVSPEGEDHFKFCDSIVWAGRALLRAETQNRSGPLHYDDMTRAALVINAIAIHPDVFEMEISEIAYKFLDDSRDLAKEEGLPLWAQFPEVTMGNLEELFKEIGFIKVENFELDLVNFANEEQRRRSQWGVQKWTQWLLRKGNWEQGRRY